MSLTPVPERIPLPAPPLLPARPPFPIVATVAPVGIAVLLWLITASPYALLFALLGPVLAVAGLADARLGARRGGRAARERALSEVERMTARMGERRQSERERMAALAVEPAPAGGMLPVLLGWGTIPDAVEFDGDPDSPWPAVQAALDGFRAAAESFPDAPVVVDVRRGIGVVGPPLVAEAMARAVEAQLGARREDAAGGLLQLATSCDALPPGSGAVVRLDTAEVTIEREGSRGDRVREFRPRFASRAQLVAALGRGRARSVDPEAGLPDRVALEALLGAPGAEVGAEGGAGRTGLAVPIGTDGAAPVELDLVAQGPHALIAGTTGSGKSELLVSWVVAMADRYPPERVTFLLIDFKGGAAFAPLDGIPHVVGTLSDLDARLTARAVLSLRAELRRRERTLAEHSARTIDELPPGALARLVIVVDEFAALVTDHPELHPVFADLASRGRSLGLHLVLCTQRPAGVVRDGVLANITLRLSFRVLDRADSVAVVGTDSAAALPLEPRGRAILADGSGATRTIQLAIAGEPAMAGARERHPPAPTALPWCAPLPRRLELDAVPDGGPGIVFGLSDQPAQQRQPAAVFDPARHGALLVLGASGSGKSTALATVAESACARDGYELVSIPSSPADGWEGLHRLAGRNPDAAAGGRILAVLDDLDVLLGGLEPEHRHEASDALGRLIRQAGPRGIAVVASARSAGPPLSSLAPAFGSRLLLRLASRDEHMLAGGDGAGHDAVAPAGSGTWLGDATQVAISGRVTAVAERVAPPPVLLEPRAVTAVVSARPRAARDALTRRGVHVIELADARLDDAHPAGGASSPIVLLGDPDSWQAAWELLGLARRELPIVMIDCTLGDHRAITRSRELPPPLGSLPGECWLLRDGVSVRAVL